MFRRFKKGQKVYFWFWRAENKPELRQAKIKKVGYWNKQGKYCLQGYGWYGEWALYEEESGAYCNGCCG